MIKVNTKFRGSFYVKDPKKIKFWKKMATLSRKYIQPGQPDHYGPVSITEVKT